jgi:hypothetical protein
VDFKGLNTGEARNRVVLSLPQGLIALTPPELLLVLFYDHIRFSIKQADRLLEQVFGDLRYVCLGFSNILLLLLLLLRGKIDNTRWEIRLLLGKIPLVLGAVGRLRRLIVGSC